MATWKSIPIAGGGCGQAIALSADLQRMVIFADTQGPYMSNLADAGVSNHGDAWRVIGGGIGAKDKYREGVAVVESTTETSPHVWYALVGSGQAGGATGGGLIAYNESTALWSLRSSVVQGAGNHTSSPLTGTWRPTGHLLVMEPIQGGTTYLWAGGYGMGIQRSPCTGTTGDAATWVKCQVNGSASGVWYVRSIAMDPSLTTVYTSLIDSSGAFSGIYITTNGHATTPNFTKLSTQPTGNVHDLWLMGGFLYAACGANGLWRMKISTGVWSNLNGSFIPGGSNLWTALTGYIDGSSNHIILLGNHAPQHDSPATANHDGCGITVTITSGGAVSYQDLPAVQHSVTPGPSGTTRAWWRAGSGYHNWWGGHGFFAPMCVVDASGSPVKWYVTGSEGSSRFVSNAEGWTISDNGQPMFLGHPVWAAKQNAGYGAQGDSDWGFIGWSTVSGIPAKDGNSTYNEGVGGAEAFSIAGDYFDDTIFVGSGAKYSGSSGGALKYRLATNPGASNWTNISLPAAVGTSVPMGLCVGRDGAHDATGNKVLIAGISGNGVWRWTQSGGWNEVDNNNGEGTWGPTGANRMPMQWAHGTGDMAAYDHGTGKIFYTIDTGNHWYLLWTKAGGVLNNLAFHPANRGELWVSTGSGLYSITNAHTGAVGSGATLHGPYIAVPNNGPIAYAAAGVIDATNPTIVCAQDDTGTGSGIKYSTSNGSTWKDGQADGSFAALNFGPEDMDIDGQNGMIYVSGSNIVTYGSLTTGGTAPTSGAFSLVQQGLNMASASGNLAVYFNETSGGPGTGGIGAPSTVGSTILLPLLVPGSNVTVTAPNANWTLVFDINGAGSGLARVQLWAYMNNPGGLMGPGPGGAGDATNAQTFTCSPTTNIIRGKLFEMNDPAGYVTFVDQVSAGAFSATGPGAVTSLSMVVPAGPTNQYNGGMAIGFIGLLASVALTGETFTTPGGFTNLGFAQNGVADWASYYELGLAAGATAITGLTQVSSGNLANVTSWAGGIATFYSVLGTPPTITSVSPLATGTVGVAYSSSPDVTATGGVPPYTWSIISGSLPPGLSISSSTGIISGANPTTAGTYTFTVQATDSTPLSSTKSLSITINPAASVFVSTSSLPGDIIGVPY